MSDPLVAALVDLKDEEALAITRKRLEAGDAPGEILASCQAAMVQVGEKFEKGDYFLSELIFAGAIFKQISELLESQVDAQKDAAKSKGVVVIGTAAGDVHDLGKNIVAMLLKGAGYEVVDLGVDVAVEKFIEAAKETGAKVLGISALITTSFGPMKRIVELLDEEKIRGDVKVMIGGGVVDDRCLEFTGADMQSRNAYEAVKFCDQVYGVKG